MIREELDESLTDSSGRAENAYISPFHNLLRIQGVGSREQGVVKAREPHHKGFGEQARAKALTQSSPSEPSRAEEETNAMLHQRLPAGPGYPPPPFF
jgi:hypothetical protein